MKKFEFLTVKDPHVRFGFPKPEGRTVSFEEDIRKKWDFLLKYAKSNRIKNLLIPGDILDKKAPSDYSFPVLTQIERFFREVKHSGLNIYTVAGNHDLPYASYDNKGMSVYQYLCELGCFEDVSGEGINIGDVHIGGVDYRFPAPLMFEEMDRLHESLDDSKLNIVLFHAYVAPFMQRVNYVDLFHYEDFLKYSKVNMFLHGHLHLGYDFESSYVGEGNAKRKQFHVNLWSMSRLGRNYYSVSGEHKPEFAHIVFENGCVMERMCLPFKPVEEVFLLEEMEMDKEMTLQIGSFVDSLSGFRSSSGETMDVENLPEEIREKIVYYLSKASDKEILNG